MKNERHTVIPGARERFQSRIRFCATFSRSVSNYNRLFTRALLGDEKRDSYLLCTEMWGQPYPGRKVFCPPYRTSGGKFRR